MKSPAVRHVSDWFVKPNQDLEELTKPFYLSPWDLAMLSVQYIQKGLLFKKPKALESGDHGLFMRELLVKLKHSLSIALVHFYPLAGRLKTVKDENQHSSLVFVDFGTSPGAKVIYAVLDMTMSDILSAVDVPLVVQSFFDHDRAVNHDGHTMALLSIQVTELVDGVFIGCSMNHCIGDGTSFWNFFNMWSEIFQAQGEKVSISRPPVHDRWFPDGHGPIINLPFTNSEEFVCRFEAPPLRERIFHFSSASITKLKAKANAEYDTSQISSFQSLSALVWRCITRVRCLPHDQETSCRLATNNRPRLNPPLSPDYFGNSIQTVGGIATAGELHEHNLGWAAWQLHQAVVNHNDKMVRGFVETWLESPFIYQLEKFFDKNSVMIGSSPRFNKYGNEFGMGKGVALFSGYAHKFSGKVSAYPGHEGGGSIDLEVCLPSDSMKALECDNEFMDAVSISHQ